MFINELHSMLVHLGRLVANDGRMQGMARDRSGQALAWPLVSDRRGCRGSDAQGWVPKIFLRSGLERIFGCPLTVEGTAGH